jgi:hypothetical protein
MLLVLGVPTRAVMELMGWSQMSMTARCQHMAPQLVSSSAEQLQKLLWGDDQDECIKLSGEPEIST